MNWTEPRRGNEQIRYSHVLCDTPLGRALITWKDWKEDPAYDLEVGEEYVESFYGVGALEAAKAAARQYLIQRRDALTTYLDNSAHEPTRQH